MAEEIRITKDFIENELPSAPPLYVSIYLLLCLCKEEDSTEIAQRLGVLESDVYKARMYWKERGFFKESGKTEGRDAVILEQKPEYTQGEMKEYMKHQQIKGLLVSAQKKLAKPLTQQDVSMLFGFYDWLGLSVDVIEVLLSYCVSDGFKGMRYIEKVAIGWAEEGIDTVEKAAEYIEMRKSGFRSIMAAFGLGNRMPVAAEEAFMKKWIKEYKFSSEVIQGACQKTVLQTGKVSFPYADSILKKWQAAGVETLADVEMLDQAFQAKKAINQEEKPTKLAPKPKQNRFINNTQRQWDFEKMEALEREERKKW